jgi:hypothetical protein
MGMVRIQAHNRLMVTPHRTARKTLGGANPHDGSGNGMRGTHRYLERLGYKEGNGAGGFCSYAFKRCHFGDPRTHGLYDLPSAAHRTQTDGAVTGQWYPPLHMLQIVAAIAR